MNFTKVISFRESCTIHVCLCCGLCSVLTATKIVFVISLICALLESAIGVFIITGGIYSEEATSIKTKLAILGVVIILGQCCRIIVLTYWLIATKRGNMTSHSASAFCSCFSMIIILGLLALAAGYIAIATVVGNNYFYTDDVFNCTFLFLILFDLLFSVLYGLAIAKSPPQYRVDCISEQRKV